MPWAELQCFMDRCVVSTTLAEGVTLKAGLSQTITCERAWQPRLGVDTRKLHSELY